MGFSFYKPIQQLTQARNQDEVITNEEQITNFNLNAVTSNVKTRQG